ncbi:uncharacterized protein LOC119721588 [Patiria miniata]|uniref:Uncharacterized protein n=1 Tax=Patiria miniata TaxID=46514 RepID=A0A913Z9N1_PATMI|nr:uncharacterized protein LOC119721588 [Patiria miniata]
MSFPTGVRKWNHRGSTVFSIIWPLLLIALCVLDIINSAFHFWGRNNEVFHLIHNGTYLSVVLLTPVLCLIANISHIISDHRGSSTGRFCSWRDAFSVRNIVKCLQHLELEERGLPYKAYLALCIILPCIDEVYLIYIRFYVYQDITYDVLAQISVIGGIFVTLVWAAFCYLTLLLRLSFQKQQGLVLAFVWRHAGKIDVCRRRLADFAEELRSMIGLVSVWIMVIVPVSTWAFTTLVVDYWTNYGVIYDQNASQVYRYGLVWYRRISFLIMPLFALGEMAFKNTWSQFRRAISRMRNEEQDVFWDKILAFCEEQPSVSKVGILILAFSTLGFFLGLNFPKPSGFGVTSTPYNSVLQSPTPSLF